MSFGAFEVAVALSVNIFKSLYIGYGVWVGLSLPPDSVWVSKQRFPVQRFEAWRDCFEIAVSLRSLLR